MNRFIWSYFSLNLIIFFVYNESRFSPINKTSKSIEPKFIEDFRYMASLSIHAADEGIFSLQSPYKEYCAATIIGWKWAISEMSCYTSEEDMHVYYGSKHIFRGFRNDVAIAYRMSNYMENGDIYYPYMLLKLKYRFYNYVDLVWPARLPTHIDEDITKWIEGNVTGFEEEKTGELHGRTLKVLTYDECRKNYPEMDGYMRPSDFCAGVYDKDNSCNEDRGLPFVINNTLLGISRAIKKCGNFTRPVVFASVTFARDWICYATGL